MYPHQVLMEEKNLQKKDLSKEAQNYLKDFNHFHRGVSLKQSRAEKAGKEWQLSESDEAKLNRFSKSVCVQIYEDMNTTFMEAQRKKAEEKKLQEEAAELKRIQEEEDIKRKQEAEQKQKEEAEEQARAFAKEQAERQEQERKRKEEEESSGGLFDYFF